MIPSVDDRLATMMTAMEKLIIPALGTGDALALEQAGLLLGHLKIVREQFDHAVRYEQFEWAELRDLTDDLLAQADGGRRTADAAATLAAAHDGGTRARLPADIRAAIGQMNEGVEQLVSAAGIDGSAAFRDISARAVLAFSRQKALRDRAWFAGSGFETDGDVLPDIGSLVRELYDAPFPSAATSKVSR